MKKASKFNVGMALGSLTAAVALLTGVPVFGAFADDTSDAGQAAPGGGAFPGSFLVPGTNTSIKIGGFAKGVYIYDMSAADGAGIDADVVAIGALPLEGTAAHQMHGATRLHARQSNVNFQTATPTAWGELDTFILLDFFGQNTAQAQNGANTQNARLVLAYGALGPFAGGQMLSLFFDGDALGESVDPTVSVGIMNGLTNRHPQFRYTYAGANGLSIAGSVEEPVWEMFDNEIGPLTTNTDSSLTVSAAGLASGANGWSRYPDFVLKGRWDQAWGHIALAGAIRDQEVYSQPVLGVLTVPRKGETGWVLMLSGHLNTFGKDTLRGGVLGGQAVGHYLSDMGSSAGLRTNFFGPGGPVEKAPTAIGANISYTHWWTDELRSTAMAGYSHVYKENSVITNPVIANLIDMTHESADVNLVWSPVPQVDLGIEFDYGKRYTSHILAGTKNSNEGNLNRLEAEAVFKF